MKSSLQHLNIDRRIGTFPEREEKTRRNPVKLTESGGGPVSYKEKISNKTKKIKKERKLGFPFDQACRSENALSKPGRICLLGENEKWNPASGGQKAKNKIRR